MNRQLKWISHLVIFLLVFILLYLFFLLRPIWVPIIHMIWLGVIPFIISAFISYLIHPFIKRLEKAGLRKNFAIAIVYFLFFTLVGLIIYFGTPIIIDQVKEFAKNIPKFAKDYHQLLHRFSRQTSNMPFGMHERFLKLINYYEVKFSKQFDQVGREFDHFSSFLIMLTIIPFITFYFLKDSKEIGNYLIRIVPKKWRANLRSFVLELDRSLGGYIRGQLFVCVLIGVCSAIALSMIKMKYPIVLSIFIGVTNIIPTFGPIIGAIPAVLIAMTISKIMVIKVLIVIFVLQTVEGNLISPIIMGKSLQLHPLLIIFSLLVGEEICGILGLVLSVPVLAVLKTVIVHGKVYFKKANRQESSVGFAEEEE